MTSAAAHTAPIGLEAQLLPESTLQMQGALSVPVGEASWQTSPDAPGPTVLAKEIRLTVYELREQALDGIAIREGVFRRIREAVLGDMTVLQPEWTRDSRSFAPSALSFETGIGEASWRVLGLGVASLGLEGAHCEIGARHHAPASFHGLQTTSQGNMTLLHAECDAQQLGFASNHPLLFYNVTIRITEASGTTWSLQTGTFRETNKTSRLPEDVVRIGMLEMLRVGDLGRTGPISGLVIDAPRMANMGSVVLPVRVSQLRWGELDTNRPPASPFPEGLFELWADLGRTQVFVAGTTQNAPRLEEGPHVPSSSVKKIPAVVVGATTFLLAPLLLRFFTRHTSRSILENPHRRRIHEELIARGPTRLTDLAKRLGCRERLVAFHASKLVRHGLLHWQRVGRAVFFAPRGCESQEILLAAWSRHDAGSKLFAHVPHGTALSQSDLARRAQIPQSYAHRLLKSMVRDGLLVETPAGARRVLYARRSNS